MKHRCVTSCVVSYRFEWVTEGTLATQVPPDGSVTGAKLSSNVVRSNNIVAGVITSNHIAVRAITGNLIPARAISPNHIVTGSITGNLYALNSISGNLLVTNTNTGNLINVGAVSGNQLGIYSVSGNNIGTGAISANNFAGGGITSNVLASNLNISVSRTLETATINATAIGGTGNVNIDIVNNTVRKYLCCTMYVDHICHLYKINFLRSFHLL